MFTKIWLWIKQFGLVGYAVLALLGGFLFMILRNTLAGSGNKKDSENLARSIAEKQTDIRIARAENAVKIATARNEETHVTNSLEEISKIDDKKSRLKALIELRKSL